MTLEPDVTRCMHRRLRIAATVLLIVHAAIAAPASAAAHMPASTDTAVCADDGHPAPATEHGTPPTHSCCSHGSCPCACRAALEGVLLPPSAVPVVAAAAIGTPAVRAIPPDPPARHFRPPIA